ncbi:hypothetical protein NQZ79_g8209 [Umbelopsis isabellina]|nr:hypothetical protein NQZ79_g8209 [Umbelopsis isabellina]
MRKQHSKFRLLVLSTASLLSLATSSVDTSYIPNLDLSAFQQLGICGDFAGLSRFVNANQFETLDANTATIIQKYSNNTFERVASTAGAINTACKLPQSGTNDAFDVYFAGSFSNINNTTTNNIAKLDTQTGQITSLGAGLNGPVYTLYCDASSSTVYAGGAFNTSAMMWRSGTWVAMPWAGLDGPVYTISSNPVTNTVFFGGSFQSTMNGVYGNSTVSQPVPLSPPSSVSGGNSASNPNRNDPGSIVCPNSTSTVHNYTWLLEDDTPGYWEADFGDSVTPQSFRLSNVHYDNRGTDQFGILALGTNSYYELSYTDPATGQLETCVQNCSLSNNASILYQDFTVINSFPTQGLRIEIFSWFGCGGGLSFVEIFTTDNILHASNGVSNANCSDTPQGSTTTTGNWQESFIQGSYQYALTTTFPSSQLTTNNASILFEPHVTVSGMYQLYVTTPGCVGASSCGQRTQVDLTLSLSPGNSSIITVDQTNTADVRQLLYTGMVSASTTAFAPSIQLKVAKNAVSPSSGIVSIVADSIELIANGTGATLVSILEFSMQNFTSNITSYKPLANQLPIGSIVNAIEASSGDLYIGGTFTANQGSNNIVKYNYAQSNYSALGNIQLNGSVSSLKMVGSSLFAGGNFTSTANGTTPATNYFGKYDTQAQTWASLPQASFQNEVDDNWNGAVTSFMLLSDNQTLLVSGTVDGSTGNSTLITNRQFATNNNSWIDPSYLLLGGVSGTSSNANGDIYFGNLLGAETVRASDVALLATDSTISSTPSSLFNSSNIMVNAGVVWDQQSNPSSQVLAVAGYFSVSPTMSNVAILKNNTWSGLNATIQGQVDAMAAVNNLLFIGGNFNASFSNQQSSGFMVYDVEQQQGKAAGRFSNDDASATAVNVIRINPSDNDTVVVGGRFDNAGSLNCVNICSFNVPASQWQPLGTGLQGNVNDITYANSVLLAAGNLSIQGVATYAATYNSGSQTWSPFNQTLPGPVASVFVNNAANQVIFAGNTSSSLPYIGLYANNNLTLFDIQLGPTSNIYQVFAVPMQPPNGDSLLASSQTMLMVSGRLDIQGYGNVSSALFDGTTWYPSIFSTTASGNPGTIRQMFYKAQSINYGVTYHMPVPLVILVAIGGSLGITFVGVAAGMGVIYFRKLGIF